MPTKAELEEEVESLKRSNSALRGQITKLQEAAEEQPEEEVSTSFRGKIRTLLQSIENKGLVHQIGNKGEYDDVKDAM